MQRVLTGVSSTQPHETRVWVAVLLVAHFFSFVQGWNVDGRQQTDDASRSFGEDQSVVFVLISLISLMITCVPSSSSFPA